MDPLYWFTNRLLIRYNGLLIHYDGPLIRYNGLLNRLGLEVRYNELLLLDL